MASSTFGTWTPALWSKLWARALGQFTLHGGTRTRAFWRRVATTALSARGGMMTVPLDLGVPSPMWIGPSCRIRHYAAPCSVLFSLACAPLGDVAIASHQLDVGQSTAARTLSFPECTRNVCCVQLATRTDWSMQGTDEYT